MPGVKANVIKGPLAPPRAVAPRTAFFRQEGPANPSGRPKNRTRNFRPLNATKTNGRAPKRRGRPNSQAPLSERLLHPFGRERCMAHPHAGELHHRI